MISTHFTARQWVVRLLKGIRLPARIFVAIIWNFGDNVESLGILPKEMHYAFVFTINHLSSLWSHENNGK